jgi:hypothetical protein
MDNCGCDSNASFLGNDNLSGNNMQLPSNNNGMNNNGMNNNGMNNNGMNNNGMNNNGMNNNGMNDLNVQQNVQQNVQPQMQPNVQPNVQPQMNAPPSANEILRAVVNNNNGTQGLSTQTNLSNVGGKVNVATEKTVALSAKNFMLALVFLVALSWNDAIRYFISRNIKLNRASPYYYLYYALIVTLLAVVITNVLA